MESSDSNNKGSHSYFSNIHMWSINLKTGTVDDLETVSCAFSLLCLILYMSGWSDVENEQRSGCGE